MPGRPHVILMVTMTDRWMFRLEPRAAVAEANLICFPYAGGGAATFRLWPGRLPSQLAVWVVRLPGRASRLDEPAVADMAALADGIAEAVTARADVPFMFFGHSMGAVLACETAHALARRQAPMPLHLIVSGRRPPGMPGMEAPIHRLPDDAFIAAVGDRYGAIPAELIREPEVMALMLPGLRADFTALETFQPGPRAPLDCPISVFGGVHDRLAPRAHLEAWRGQTTGPVRLRLFPGGHFYLNDQHAALLAEVSTVAAPMLRDAVMSDASA